MSKEESPKHWIGKRSWTSWGFFFKGKCCAFFYELKIYDAM